MRCVMTAAARGGFVSSTRGHRCVLLGSTVTARDGDLMFQPYQGLRWMSNLDAKTPAGPESNGCFVL